MLNIPTRIGIVKFSPAAPLVSVVMPSFNHEKYIVQSIMSVLEQDYPSIELIVVDDGSSDASPALVTRLSAQHNIKFIQKLNGGVVSAINAGFEAVTGQYVVLHATDDQSLQGRLRRQVKQLETCPHAGYVTGNARLIDANDNEIGMLRDQGCTGLIFDFNDFMYGRARSCVVTCMFRASALSEVMPLNPDLLAEDFQVFMRITNRGWRCLVWEQEPVINYRILNDSMARTRMAELMQAQLRMLEDYKEHSGYRIARRITQNHIFAAKLERDGLCAFKMLRSLNVNPFVPPASRAIARFLVPQRLRKLFGRIR